jgi:hypothetical protein
MALSNTKVHEIAQVIVDAIRAVPPGRPPGHGRHCVDFVCYWFSSQGWAPWQIKDLDAVAMVAQTAAADEAWAPHGCGPDTWHPDWKRINEAAIELEVQPKRPSTSKALKPVPTPVVRGWLKAAREGGGAFRPRGWGRDFTIDNLVAEMSQRPDRQAPTKEDRRVARREKAQAARRSRQSFKRPPGWRES